MRTHSDPVTFEDLRVLLLSEEQSLKNAQDDHKEKHIMAMNSVTVTCMHNNQSHYNHTAT